MINDYRAAWDRVLEVASYTELKAMKAMAPAVQAGEPAAMSAIADRGGFTRSTVINAIRLLEAAGLVKHDSLGMKGTLIKANWSELPTAMASVKV